MASHDGLHLPPAPCRCRSLSPLHGPCARALTDCPSAMDGLEESTLHLITVSVDSHMHTHPNTASSGERIKQGPQALGRGPSCTAPLLAHLESVVSLFLRWMGARRFRMSTCGGELCCGLCFTAKFSPQGGVAHHRPLAPTPALKQCRLVVWQQIINSYEWPLMHLRDHTMCVFGRHSPAAGVMALHAAAINCLVANDHSWFTSAWRSVRMCGLYTKWSFPLVLCCAYHFLPVSGNTT